MYTYIYIYSYISIYSFVFEARLVHERGMTHSYVWHDLYNVRHDSFLGCGMSPSLTFSLSHTHTLTRSLALSLSLARWLDRSGSLSLSLSRLLALSYTYKPTLFCSFLPLLSPPTFAPPLLPRALQNDGSNRIMWVGGAGLKSSADGLKIFWRLLGRYSRHAPCSATCASYRIGRWLRSAFRRLQSIADMPLAGTPSSTRVHAKS